MIEEEDDDESLLDKLREKNKQLQRLLDELKDLEDQNHQLNSQVNELKHKFSDATDHLNQSAQDMRILLNRVKETQEMNKTILEEKEQLIQDNSKLHIELKSLKENEDSLSRKLSLQVDKVIQVVKEKDQEIERLTLQLRKYTTHDEEGEEIVLTDLKNKLKDATATIQYQTVLIEQLQKQERLPQEEKTKDMDPDNVLFQRLEQLEQELQEKDDKINNLTMKMKSYEEGHYGLPDALMELELMKDTFKRKDEQVISLTKQLNDMSNEMNDTQDELDYIKECVNLSSVNIPDFNSLDSVAKRTKQDRLKLLKLQQQLIKMEDEKIDLEQEIRALRNRVNSLKSSPDSNDSLVQQIAQLQLENHDLQMGMKEILLGIHESDGKSDVTIDCPVLERLLVFLESREISSDLMTVLALKAELDLIRGYNGELRAQLKQVRCEHLKVLSLYTADVLGPENDDDEENHGSDDENESKSEGHDSDISEGQVLPTHPEIRLIVSPAEEEQTEAVEPSAPDFPDLPIPKILVEDASNTEKKSLGKDSSTQTDLIQQHWMEATPSPSPFPVKHKHHGITSSTIKKCSRCSRLIRALNEIKSLLIKTEKSIRSSDDVTMTRIQQLQAEYTSVVSSLQESMKQMSLAIKTRDSIIQVLRSSLTPRKRHEGQVQLSQAAIE